jgi:hypothetical protein
LLIRPNAESRTRAHPAAIRANRKAHRPSGIKSLIAPRS